MTHKNGFRSLRSLQPFLSTPSLPKVASFPRCYGPEFIARAIQRWLATRQIAPLYIAPGSPWENGYSESFNSRMKAEFADREVFASLVEAKVLGAEYKRYWNQERLHSGIAYQTPAEFAAALGPDSATLRPPQVPSQHQATLINTGT